MCVRQCKLLFTLIVLPELTSPRPVSTPSRGHYGHAVYAKSLNKGIYTRDISPLKKILRENFDENGSWCDDHKLVGQSELQRITPSGRRQWQQGQTKGFHVGNDDTSGGRPVPIQCLGKPSVSNINPTVILGLSPMPGMARCTGTIKYPYPDVLGDGC